MRSAIIKIIILLTAAALLSGTAWFSYKYLKYQKEPGPQAVEFSKFAREITQETGEIEATRQAETGMASLPEELNLKMAFYPQAPFGNWDMPWQEACEEASVLLVANEYLGKNWTAEQFNDEILKLVEWEKKIFGDYKHTTVRETAKILNEYLGLKTLIYENPTYEDVKKILARGHLIVITFDGKKIGNPFYKNGGPVYHAMVIKGYKSEDKVITHDVGTRRGEDYVYPWATLQNAMHDYAVPMSDGAKRIIEVIPL